MLVSAAFPHSLLCNPNYLSSALCFCHFSAKLHLPLKQPLLLTSASSSTDNSSLQNSIPKPNVLHHVIPSSDEKQPDHFFVPSAAAVSSAIRRASTSPVEFVQRMEKDQKGDMVLPSADFLRLCAEQLDLFRRVVDPDAFLSVYVRPAGGYVMDRLELRRVISYSGESVKDIVLLIGNFDVPTGLRAAEAALSNSQVEVFPEHRAVVFPMVKKPFVVGFLVAELPMLENFGDLQREAYALSAGSEMGIRTVKDDLPRMFKYSDEQQSTARNITRSLAMAYVMDQKAMLLQQSSWQNNVRMSNLVEQIRGPLSSIRTLSKMLSVHMKRSEIAHDVVEDIMVQGDRIKDTLEELQDAVYLTKANIVRYNQETLKKMYSPIGSYPESVRSQLKNVSVDASSIVQEQGESVSQKAAAADLEIPMPPMAIAPLQQHGIRPCNVSDVLGDLVGAIRPLALKQRRGIELNEISHASSVAIEEPALRQALSNLIEGALLRTRVGGKVEILSTGAPAGGTLVFIDDDGPDMHYMTQMHSLTPFGADLSSADRVEDNMTWNFVAGLTVAREILESYSCVVRVISPRITDAALGTGGTRIELWLPS